MKHVSIILILSLALALAIPSALAASNAPASQFGFKGWPYLKDTSCVNAGGGSASCGQQTARAAGCGASGTARYSDPDARPSKAAPASTVSTGDYTTNSASAQEQKLLNLVNADRTRNGLSALPLDDGLSDLARLKSQDFVENRYFAHESPAYGTASQMLDTYQYDYRGVGENIAHHATVEKAEAAFMSSDGHRRNILGSQWEKVGIGVVNDQNGFVYVTELFAR